MTHQIIYGPHVDRSEKQDRSWTQNSWFSKKNLAKKLSFIVTLFSVWLTSDIMWRTIDVTVPGSGLVVEWPGFSGRYQYLCWIIKKHENIYNWAISFMAAFFHFFDFVTLKKWDIRVRYSGHVNLGPNIRRLNVGHSHKCWNNNWLHGWV